MQLYRSQLILFEYLTVALAAFLVDQFQIYSFKYLLVSLLSLLMESQNVKFLFIFQWFKKLACDMHR